MGVSSSTRRPTLDTILSMIRIRWASSLNAGHGLLDLAAPLHVDVAVPVHQNVVHRRVFQQGLERPQPEDLVLDRLDQALALFEGEQHVLLVEDKLGGQRHVVGDPIFTDLAHPRQIQVFEELVVDP